MDDDELIVRLARGDDRALRELFQRHAPMPAAWRTPSTTRLAWLHLRSRRVPSALAALAGCGAVLWAALAHHWWPETGHTASEFPMFIEGGAAAVIAVTTHSPFGEPERAAGRWLPFLRLSTALVLCGAAIGLLALAAAVADNPQAGIGLSTGILAVAENVLRFAGIGLVFSRITGGLTAWTGPLGFMSVCQFAKVANFSEPLTWAARPAADRGGWIAAMAVCAAGLAAFTVMGPRVRPSGD